MQKRLTYFLLLLVVGTMAMPTSGQLYKRIQERFPTADWDQQDLPDPEKNAKRKAKQKRYNDTELVASEVRPGTDEAALMVEPPIVFPALPVAESDIVVVGTIETAQAHLSENKRNVFSEFTLTVEDVLKSKIQGIGRGSVLTVDRVGGHVKYPNGQIVLYRMGNVNMPQVGWRYLLFLTRQHNNEDISILAAYHLSPDGAIPLDDLQQAKSLEYVSEDDILQKVRTLLKN